MRAVLDHFGYNQELEHELAEHRARVRADDRLAARFATLVWVPLRGSIQFDPREVRSWDLGTFYKTLSVTTAGARLTARDGAIVTADWRWIGLPAAERPSADAEVLTGPGWTLSVADPDLRADITWGPTPPG